MPLDVNNLSLCVSENAYTVKEYIQEMDKRHTERLNAIYDEVKKTNGRVRELEKWRSYLTGAVALAVALGLPNLIALATTV